MNRSQEITIQTGLTAAIIIAPLLFGAVHPWTAMPLSGLLLLLLFLNPSAIDPLRNLPHFFSAGMILLIAYLAVQAFFLSSNQSAALRELIQWSAIGAGFLLIQNCSRSGVRFFCYLFVFLGVAECLYGLYQLHQPTEHVLWRIKTQHVGYLTGTYFNRNHLAGLLELSLGMQCGILFHFFRRKKILRILLLTPVFCLCLYGLFKTGSRMGAAAFILTLTLFTLIILARREKGAGAVAFFVFLLLGYVGMLSIRALENRWEEYQLAASGFWGGRLTAWQDGISMVRGHLWTGIGPGNFEWIFPAYQSPGLQWNWTHLHQDYLELLAGLGVPAFAVLVISFFDLFINLIRKAPSYRDYAFFWGSMMGVTMLFFHGFTDFNLAIPANAMLWMFLLAISWRLAMISEEEE